MKWLLISYLKMGKACWPPPAAQVTAGQTRHLGWIKTNSSAAQQGLPFEA
jgi:hypothetical protein